MSLILKQEPAASIPTPPAGKGTLFINDSAALSVKSPDGNVTLYPTASGSNTQIFFNDANTINGNSNLTFTKTTGTLATFALTVTSNSNVGNLGTAGLIVATGNVTGGNITTAGRLVSSIATGTAPLTITSTTRVANLSVDYSNVSDFINVTAPGTGTGYIVFANATTGNVAEWTTAGITSNLANNSITATTFVGALSGAATSATTAGTVTTNAQPNITSTGTLTSLIVGNATANTTFGNGIFTATGNANVGNLGTAGLIVATGNVTGGNLVTGGALSVTGNITAGNISATNHTGTTSNITGQYITTLATGTAPFVVTSTTQVANLNVATAGVAGTVTTAAQGNITSVGTLTGLGVNGTVTAVNITANTGVFTGNANGISSVQAGNIVGTTLGATVVTSSLTTVGTLGSLTVTGNVTGGNLVTGGVLTVNGTGVSSIAGNLDMTSNTIINLATPTNSTDAATKQYVDDVAQGLNIHDSCNAATQTTLATISGGTITYNNGTAGVGATLTTTGSYTTIDGVTLADGMRILVKNEATAANNGIYVRTSATVLTRAADFNTPAEMEGGDFTFITAGTLYDNTGWVMTDAVTTVGTSPVNWVQFSGAGTYTAGTGLTLTGSTFSVNASQTQVTSVGTLTSLGVTGTTTSGNFATAGNITASFLVSNVATGTAPLTVTSTTRVNNLNVAYANVADFISVAAGTGNNFIIFANAATGNITELTSTGLIANLSNNSITATTFVGALSGAATSATTAGTVTTAAQPNITSVGTLSSVAVTGNATMANVVASTYDITGVATGISAAGATQATGTVLAKAINVVSTVLSGNGVVLPVAVAGMRITVINTSANVLAVYPAVNGIINAAAANVAYSAPAGAKLDFVSTTTTQWYTLNATYN